LFTTEVFPVCNSSLLKFGPRLGEPRDLKHHTLLHGKNARRLCIAIKLARLRKRVCGRMQVLRFYFQSGRL